MGTESVVWSMPWPHVFRPYVSEEKIVTGRKGESVPVTAG